MKKNMKKNGKGCKSLWGDGNAAKKIVDIIINSNKENY